MSPWTVYFAERKHCGRIFSERHSLSFNHLPPYCSFNAFSFAANLFDT